MVIPYVSRVLLPEGVGIASYSNSIVSYFVLFATLGTSTYGQRAIGYNQKDKESRSRLFWEIFLLRTIMSFITIIAYIAFIFLSRDNRLIYLILGINILNVIVDVTWFYQGIEEFAKISFISVAFRVVYVVTIFLFIKTVEDLSKYLFFTSILNLIPNIILWLPLRKYICFVKNVNPFHDFKTVIQLFIPTLAIQVYSVLDKSMIGWISGSFNENGYYERAESIAKIALTLITSLSTVMAPRISRKFKEGDMDSVRNYIYVSYRFVWLLAIPIMIGLVSIANIFVPIFLGEAFTPSILLLQIFSALVIIIGLNNVTALQYLVPVGKQNIYTFSVVIGAVVNFLLNMVLIRFYGALGACIASVFAELCVTMIAFICIWKTKQYSLKKVFFSSYKYWIAGIIMGVVVVLVKQLLPIKIWALAILIIIGVFVYFLVLTIERDEMFVNYFCKIFNKLFRRRSLKNQCDLEVESHSCDNTSNE